MKLFLALTLIVSSQISFAGEAINLSCSTEFRQSDSTYERLENGIVRTTADSQAMFLNYIPVKAGDKTSVDFERENIFSVVISSVNSGFGVEVIEKATGTTINKGKARDGLGFSIETDKVKGRLDVRCTAI